VETNQLGAALSGRYEIEREIGAGGMATVYLARDVKHHRKVALKVLKPELGAVLGVERFLAEIEVTANLQHPNLLPLFDSGEANGLLFYVMPFVEGESLRARLDREKQLPIAEAIRISVALASALDYAHSRGVIHRDLKPENILIQAGQPEIADFGIALAVSKAGGARVTQTGLSLGTPQYMSPEQATGDRTIDARSDIYSLAAVTYEMLTGEPPHMGTTAQAIIARVLTEHPRSVRSTRPNVPEHVDQALAVALEKLPADRWGTAMEFAEALQGKATSRQLTVAQRGGETERALRARSWSTRLRDPLVLALAGLCIGMWATAIVSSRRTGGQTSEAAVRFAIPLEVPNVSGAQGALGATLAISPDGGVVAFIANIDGADKQVFVRPLNDVSAHVLPGTEGVDAISFSPDGRWLVFTQLGRLLKVALDGGSVIPIGSLKNPAGVSWSASDVVIGAEATSRGLIVFPTAGGEERLLAHPDPSKGENGYSWPVALADGDHVLFTVTGVGGARAARLAIASLATGKSASLELPGASAIGVLDGQLLYVTTTQTLMAVPFDVGKGRVTGTQVPVVYNVLLGPNGAAQAGVSANGTLVYESGLRASQLVLSDSHGATKPLLAETRSYAYPRLSPDGHRLAFTISAELGSDIWTYDMTSGTTARLTTDGFSNERPEWTPDGKRILYRSDRGPTSALWWQPADLSGPPTPLLTNVKAAVFEGVITPDGRSVAYQLDSGLAQLQYRDLHGDTTPKVISSTTSISDQPRISPDGRWVAFESNATGRNQVVVQPFPGPGAQVQVSIAGGSEPVWTGDGRRLIYRDGRQFVAASVITSPTFAVTARTPLFPDVFVPAPSPHANYDVSRDGQNFILLKPTESAQLFVVHNWRAELRARLAGRKPN